MRPQDNSKGASVILALVVFFIFAGPTASQTDLNPPVYDPLIFENFRSDAPAIREYVWGRTKRMKFAKGLQEALTEIDKKVVMLSPSQRDWLRNAYFDEIRRSGNTYNQKSLDAMDTVEYRTHVIKDLYLFNLLPVLEWLSRPDAPNYSFRLEMTYWAAIAKRLASSENFQAAVVFLARKNSTLRSLSSGEFTSDPHLLASNMGLRSQQILESIIQPYLIGSLVE